jgi:hypothetical protein
MEALPFELFTTVVEYLHHGTCTSHLPLLSQFFRFQWVRYAERQARFLNQEFALGIQFPTVVTRRNPWSSLYQLVWRASKESIMNGTREKLMEMSRQLDHFRRLNAPDSDDVVMWS